MKVTGPGQTQGPSKTKKKGKSTEGDEKFGDMVSSEASSAKESVSTKSIAKVDSLLAAQAVEDPTERAARQRARKRSMTILDELEKLRMAMLNNSLTVGHMIDIADVVASHRAKISDPSLTAIMDEIDLRANVELAKMRMSLKREQSETANRA